MSKHLKEIAELEINNQSNIHLHKEGVFWRA